MMIDDCNPHVRDLSTNRLKNYKELFALCIISLDYN